MNRVDLIGRLTKDIELKSTPSGKSVARFTLAVGKDDKTAYISCVAWDKTASNLSTYCQKGSQIAVEGHIVTGSYESNGRKVYTTEIYVDRCTFLNTRRTENAFDTPDDDADMKVFNVDSDNLPF